MAVLNLKKIPIWVWIPPAALPCYRVTITRRDGTIDDITDIILDGSYKDGVTETIGSFTILIANGNNNYTGVWIGNEILKVYIDYGTSATTLRFRGRIEKISYPNNNVKIIGRSESLKLTTITVTKSYTNQETSTILTNLVSSYASDFTVSNVNVSSTNLTISWNQKPFWECVKELCSAAGFEAYVDANLDFHYFATGSVKNTTECVVHDYNILDITEFAKDYSQVKNRIILYGSTDVGTLICTKEDSNSFSEINRWQEEIVNDTNITTYQEASDRADFELSTKKDPMITGDITSICLPTIAPGEQVRISAPESNLAPNYYNILSFTQKFKEGDVPQTLLTVEKEPRTISHVIKDRIVKESQKTDITNPYEMRYSYNLPFDDDSYTLSHANTQVSEGFLKLISGQTTGTFISIDRTTASTVTQAQIKVIGETLPGTNYWLSTNSGMTWESVSKDELFTFSSTGSKIAIKVELNDSATQIDSIAILYK